MYFWYSLNLSPLLSTKIENCWLKKEIRWDFRVFSTDDKAVVKGINNGLNFRRGLKGEGEIRRRSKNPKQHRKTIHFSKCWGKQYLGLISTWAVIARATQSTVLSGRYLSWRGCWRGELSAITQCETDKGTQRRWWTADAEQTSWSLQLKYCPHPAASTTTPLIRNPGVPTGVLNVASCVIKTNFFWGVADC